MTPGVAVEIFNRQHELLHLFRSRMRQRMESVCAELTFSEMRVLMHTGRHADLTQKELVERSQVDKAQMARMLASLERKGLLERRPSESDRRVRCLRLSNRGQQLFAQLQIEQERAAEEVLAHSPRELQKQLLSLLQQVRGNVERDA